MYSYSTVIKAGGEANTISYNTVVQAGGGMIKASDWATPSATTQCPGGRKIRGRHAEDMPINANHECPGARISHEY